MAPVKWSFHCLTAQWNIWWVTYQTQERQIKSRPMCGYLGGCLWRLCWGLARVLAPLPTFQLVVLICQVGPQHVCVPKPPGCLDPPVFELRMWVSASPTTICWMVQMIYKLDFKHDATSLWLLGTKIYSYRSLYMFVMALNSNMSTKHPALAFKDGNFSSANFKLLFRRDRFMSFKRENF